MPRPDPYRENVVWMFEEDVRAMPQAARAATPSGLSQSPLASCQHRIDYRGDKQ